MKKVIKKVKSEKKKVIDTFEKDPIQVFERVAGWLSFLSNLAAQELAMFRILDAKGVATIDPKTQKILKNFNMLGSYEKAMFGMMRDFYEMEAATLKASHKTVSKDMVYKKTPATIREAQKDGLDLLLKSRKG
jgi:hypothetical protein